MLANSKLLSTVMEMIIDENKQYGLFKLEKSRKTYSDLNVILLKLYLRTVTEKQKRTE